MDVKKININQTDYIYDIAPEMRTDNIVDGAVTIPKLSDDIQDLISTKLFTNKFNANKVIRKLFIDTSKYTGDVSLDGLKIDIIAKNV